MKGLIIVGLLMFASNGYAQETPAPSKIQAAIDSAKSQLLFFRDDIKANTRFKVDSAISYFGSDWTRGGWSMGEAVPFFNLGSYDYFSANVSWRSAPLGVNQAGIGNGIRLNGVTRPILKNLFNAVTLGNIEKAPLLEYLAKASAAGVMFGHDFNYEEKKNVVINSSQVWFGLEVALGSNTSPKLGAPGGIHYQSFYFR